MPRPDFGNHVVDVESCGYRTKLSCKYVVPGLTMHDLARIFDDAAKEGDSLAGNPSKWPTNLGINAVTEEILKAIYGE